MESWLAEKALKELNEVPEKVPEAIKKLRESFKEKHPDLPMKRDDDVFLLRFLRSRKFDHERAMELLFNYTKFEIEKPHMIYEPSAEAAKKIVDMKVIGLLPVRAKNGATVIFLRPANVDPEHLTLEEIGKGFAYFQEKILDEDQTQICGIMLLEDLKDLSFSKARKLDNGDQNADKYHFLQNCFPVRFKGIHMVNESIFLTVFSMIVRPFLKKKLRERFFFHGHSYKGLGEYFQMEGVPKEIGGSLDYDFQSSYAFVDGLRKSIYEKTVD